MKNELIIISHTGLGDTVGFNPAVRFYCKKYNKND